MNTLDAVRKMVDHYPGGRAVIAARLNKTDEVLRKELSGAATHKLSLLDASAIADMCCEARSEHAEALASAIACNSGGYIALPVRDMVAVQDLRSDGAQIVKEGADVVVTLTVALADNTVSDNERIDLERKLADLISKAQDALRGIRANNRAAHAARDGGEGG